MTSRKNRQLLNATRLGDLEVTSRLIHEGADVNYKDIEGNAPLHEAARAGSEASVSLLLRHRSPINEKNKYGWTPLHLAAHYGHEPVVSSLLRNNANVNEKIERLGETSLHKAVTAGREPIVSLLLRNGSLINEKNNYGHTPLHDAAKGGDESIILALLRNGAHISEKTQQGETPLDIAERYDHKKISRLFKKVLAEGLPKELQYLSTQDGASFTSTLKSGSYASHVGKVMCVGNEAVGKTAITSVLVNKTPSKKRNATEGIDLHIYKAAVDKDKKIWVPIALDLEDVAFRDLVKEIQASIPDVDTLLDDENEEEEFFNIVANKVSEKEDERKQTSKVESVSPEIKAPSGNVRKQESFLQRMKIKFGLKKATSHSKDELLQEVIRKGKAGLRDSSLAPVNMMDFGGQSVFYSTHQSFLTYRGVYILVIDGSKDFDAEMESENFIPGRHTKPTAREFTLFWVSSIEAYSQGSSANFPKIIVVCTHKDKVPHEQADQIVNKIFSEIEKMFSNSVAMNHLVLEHRIFLNARDPKDPAYDRLKGILVELLCSQPSWGEKLPKAWIHLKMIINRMVENGEKIMSMETLKSVNQENPVQILSERELIVFLKMHHSQGEIIFFPLPELKDNIIISPKFLVDALRSLITDKKFCKGRRLRTIESLNENGLLCRSDIDDLWTGNENFLKHKQYLLSLMMHLDIIATPRQYGKSDNLVESDIFYVPSLVKTIDDTDYLTRELETRSIGLSYKFHSKILPPAIGYRLIASCVDMYEIRKYNNKPMLFSGMVIVSIKRKLDLIVLLRSDRIDIYLVHTISRDKIVQSTAVGVSECLEDILVNILESYRVTSLEGKIKQVVPFHKDFPCFDITSPCFDQEKERISSIWTCKHGHSITDDMKNIWFVDRKTETTRKDTSQIKDPSIDNFSKGDLDKNPTDCQMANISLQLTKEEFDPLLVQLGLKRSEIDAIEVDYAGNLSNTKFLCLRHWRLKTNGSVQDIINAAESEKIGVNKVYEMNRNKPIANHEGIVDMYPNDRILDSIANEVIQQSLLLSVQLGFEATFWLRMKDDRFRIVDINRKVLGQWRANYQGGREIMRDLAQALCNVDVNITAVLPDA